ncbi:MAG: tetratricopeptide repeat protein, partial [Planctomycetes bacterium]|nr:tetratricopeptide repeat protein [Planctomycetota bacterium]
MTQPTQSKPSHRSVVIPVLAVSAAAVVMGIPTLGGSFVGGDDHRLLLNHVWVNHPSLEHALKLFTIYHRDLYQPLPLLTFQAEFAIAKGLGLFDEGLAGGARLFHLTNILLHALNAVLVWFVVRMLCRRVEPHAGDGTAAANQRSSSGQSIAIATVAALLFAIHPLQTEVVAWTNGRMMLLSTLFAMLSLLAFSSWLDRPRAKQALLVVVLVLLCAISKVRIGLPILLAVVFLAGGAKIRRGTIVLWLTCAAATAVFVVVNVRATSGASLFAEAAEHLRGPRLARVFLAMDNYLRHLVWPVGLASYYPTPPLVQWSDPATLRAMGVTIPILLGTMWACLRSRVALLGAVWFGSTIAATLPFLPARNVLAADRYMYLPIIGLAWAGAFFGHALYRRCATAWSSGSARAIVGVTAVVLVPALIGTCWHVAGFYSTPLRKTQRIANLFPDTPRVWEPVGWLHYRDERYDEAIECAEKELRHDAPAVRSGAHQLIGMCEMRRGNVEVALERLRKALDINPESTLAKYRLARAYDDLGYPEKALPLYRLAVEQAPGHNPTINRLAKFYHRLGRIAESRAAYQQQIDNNPYDVPGAMGLVELDIEEGTAESYRRAETRLRKLLDWMPENTDALTNLGAVLVGLGRGGEAVEVYETALSYDARCVPAALNLANLRHNAGSVGEAKRLYELAVSGGLFSVSEVSAVHDFFVSQGDLRRTVVLWRDFSVRFPESLEAHALLGWSQAISGLHELARSRAVRLTGDAQPPPPARATPAFL